MSEGSEENANKDSSKRPVYGPSKKKESDFLSKLKEKYGDASNNKDDPDFHSRFFDNLKEESRLKAAGKLEENIKCSTGSEAQYDAKTLNNAAASGNQNRKGGTVDRLNMVGSSNGAAINFEAMKMKRQAFEEESRLKAGQLEENFKCSKGAEAANQNRKGGTIDRLNMVGSSSGAAFNESDIGERIRTQAYAFMEYSSAKIGRKPMTKYGWREGQGLGTAGRGILYPLELSFRPDRAGLGSLPDGEPKPQIVQAPVIRAQNEENSEEEGEEENSEEDSD